MTAATRSCLIIADDFTGACDTGLQFVRCGFSAAVIPGRRHLSATPPVDVVVCNTESRNQAAASARQLVTEACERVRALPHSLCYKKVDSTIRGNLAAEIGAVMNAFALDNAIFAPALPAAGRTTRHGQHLLDGVPVHETELATDPGSPVLDSYLPGLLAATASAGASSSPHPPFDVKHVDIDEMTGGAGDLSRRFAAPRERRTVFVCDAVSPDHLRCIAAAAASLAQPPLLCGSAGLAQFVPEAFGLHPVMPPTPALQSAPGPVLVVVGSAHSLSRRQTDRLLARKGARELGSDSATLDNTRAHLRSTPDAVAVLSMAETPDPESTLRQLATVAVGVARDVPELAGIAVTGGTTAMELLAALDAEGVEIVEAIGREVPVCRIADGPFHGMPLVTKAGALGDEDVFVKAVERLTGTAIGVDDES